MKKILNIILAAVIAVGLFAPLLSINASAIDCCGTEVFGDSCPDELNDCGNDKNEEYVLGKIRHAITILTVVLGVVASIVIVVAGITYMTAVGDPGKMAKARKAIVGAVVGLIVLVCAYAITSLVIGALQE